MRLIVETNKFGHVAELLIKADRVVALGFFASVHV